MRLGIDLGTATTKFCLASTLLGADGRSWTSLNHRLWEEPTWLALEFGPGGPHGGAAPEIAGGRAAVALADSVEGRERVVRGHSIVWPRFPRRAVSDPLSFQEGVLLFWDAVLRRVVEKHRRCERVCLTMPWYRERLVSQALRRLTPAVPVVTLPDFYAAYLGSGRPRPEPERLLVVDPGSEACRLTVFSTWADGSARRVHVEETSEVPELGGQFIDGERLDSLEADGGLDSKLAFWLHMDAARGEAAAGTGDHPARVACAERIGQRALAAVRRFDAGQARIDRVLFLGDGRHLPDEIAGITQVLPGRWTPARGAAVFGEPGTAPVHFSFSGGIYIAVEHGRPKPLVALSEWIHAGSAGQRYGAEFPRSPRDHTEVDLLWGPLPGLGPYHRLGALSHRLARPSFSVLAGCTLQRSGMDMFGDLWILDSVLDSPPSVPWSLNLEDWAFWTVP